MAEAFHEAGLETNWATPTAVKDELAALRARDNAERERSSRALTPPYLDVSRAAGNAARPPDPRARLAARALVLQLPPTVRRPRSPSRPLLLQACLPAACLTSVKMVLPKTNENVCPKV